ncbi:MAG: sugar-binding domain-containing protein, partial [Bacteroidota bacterium]
MIRYFMLFCLFATSTLIAQEELSLDGDWEIIFDEQNEGKDKGWVTDAGFRANDDRRNIKVPSAWEIIEQDYEGVGLYRHEFIVPEDWRDKVIRLHFAAVNYLAEVWLNDEVVGFHEGGFTPFEFRVDEMIKPGESNVLIIRVVGPLTLSDKTVDGMKPMETPQWRGGLSGGIWQRVHLVATDELYLKDVYIKPAFADKSVDFQLTIDHAGLDNQETEVTVVIRENEGDAVLASSELKANLHPGENLQRLSLTVPNASSWSPDTPQLYRAEIQIARKGKVSDSYIGRFGFREFTIQDKDFYLNGQPIYLKATFFEGLYPSKVAYPDNEAMVREEIRLAKEAGFNMIRPWRKPSSELWLDIADEMGILVVGSPALECMRLPLSTPYLPARVENEIREAVLKDRSRTCIVQWELFNELHRPVLKQLMRPMAMLTRELDPTRLILDESGGWAYGANIYLPGAYEPTKFNDIHNYPGPFITNEKYDGYLSIGMTEEEKKRAGFKAKTPGRNVVPGLMSFVSELGYGSLPNLKDNNQRFRAAGNPLLPAHRYHERLDQEQAEMLRASGFQYLYPDTEAFYLDMQKVHGAANKRMIEAVRANPTVDGYCIHALSAGDWILGAGLIDLWR